MMNSFNMLISRGQNAHREICECSALHCFSPKRKTLEYLKFCVFIAVVVRGTFDIQGLVAFHLDEDLRDAFIAWMVTVPHNNKQLTIVCVIAVSADSCLQ
jgi:hypothetical protein